MHSLNAGIQNQRFCHLDFNDWEIILLYQSAATVIASFTLEWHGIARVNALEDFDLTFGTKEYNCL